MMAGLRGRLAGVIAWPFASETFAILMWIVSSWPR